MSEIKPVAYMYQHEDTGVTGFVDEQQIEWGFERNNPRLQIIGPLYDEAALAQARTEERERCANVCEDEAELASLMVKVDALNVAADRIRTLDDERTEK